MFAIVGTLLIYQVQNGNFNVNKNVSVYQGMEITYTDKTSDYIYPTERTFLTQSLFGTNNKQVLQIQSFIFLNTMTEKEVKSAEFTCNAKVELYSGDKTTLIKEIAAMPISYVVTQPTNATDTILMSASMSAGDFEAIIPTDTQSTNFYYVVKCSDITVKLTYHDDTKETTRLVGDQGLTNQLWWHFYTEQQSGTLQIISAEVQYKWA